MRRNPRISTDHELQYKQWSIPKNRHEQTPVGMSICHLHMDPEVYPEPYKFIPDRWIGDVDPRVHRKLVPFVKGSQNCLGLNLAWAEMYLVLGISFRPGARKMSLDCDESDIVPIHDSDVGIPKSNSRGLRVVAQSSNRVVATARKTSTLEAVPSNGHVLKLELDVTSLSSIDSALHTTLEKFGRIDVVVNNAGYTLVGDTESAEDGESRALFDTNFWGMVDVSKKTLGIFRDENPKTGQQGGVIVNVSSMGGWSGYPGQSFYHASKFAMEGWTEAVAKEVPPSWNIHLTNIEPGGVKTNYATSSLKPMAKRHPAYSAPSAPTNQLLGYMQSEQGRSMWAEPSALAAAIYHVVGRGTRIPIRVPLGADAWGMISKDLEDIKKDLDELKDISLGVGDAKQLETLHFLK
ncbi:MAG: hypothetical protein Q9212_005158 [Teloschistes hypoglaucus]